MREDSRTIREWAHEEFGHAELGDPRRTDRLVRMAAALAERPGGKVLDVFRSNAEQQGAYDLLSNGRVTREAMLAAVETATVGRCAGEPWVHVVVDGTSLKLADWKRQKDFGAVGSTLNGARGLKVIHAYALSPDGTPAGVLNQQWWARKARSKRRDCKERPLAQKETLHWVRAIDQATRAVVLAGSRAWFQVDREADRYWTLAALHRTGQWFTVRSTYGHRFVTSGSSSPRGRLHDAARKGKFRGTMTLDLPARLHRKGRTAQLRIRTTPVTLDMVEAYEGQQLALTVNVVDVREVGTTPRCEKSVHWRLLTNRQHHHEERRPGDHRRVHEAMANRGAASRVEVGRAAGRADAAAHCLARDQVGDTRRRDRRTHRTAPSARPYQPRRVCIDCLQRARDPSPHPDEAQT